LTTNINCVFIEKSINFDFSGSKTRFLWGKNSYGGKNSGQVIFGGEIYFGFIRDL
jgi:hypothetical protein